MSDNLKKSTLLEFGKWAMVAFGMTSAWFSVLYTGKHNKEKITNLSETVHKNKEHLRRLDVIENDIMHIRSGISRLEKKLEN